MSSRFFIISAFLFMTTACGGSAPASSSTEVAPATVNIVTEAPTEAAAASDEKAALTAALVAADKADGTEDKVISKCAGCKLHMDGSPDHAVTVGDYTAHLCSSDCKTNFEQNGDEILKGLPQG